MIRVTTALAIVIAATSVSALTFTSESGQQQRADIEGTWSARVSTSNKAGTAREPRLQLQMNLDDERSSSNWGQSVPISAFSNLPSNLDPAQDVTFELRRDAGLVRFTGRFEGGRGVGHLSFTANPDFRREMERQTRDIYSERELFSFALLDVSRQFVKELQSLGFRDVTLDDARKARIHGVSREYIETMRAQGLRDASLDEFVRFRIHGVTHAFVKEMTALGLAGDIDDVLQARIHGVTPAFAKDMAALGYKGLEFDDLRKFRIHGVSAAFIREMAALGYKNVDADTLVKFRIHGVTPAFVKELEAAGYRNLSEDELVEWAIHGRRLLKMRRK